MSLHDLIRTPSHYTGRKARRNKSAKWSPRLEVLESRDLPNIDLTSVGVWLERGPGPIVGGDGANVGGTHQDNPVAGAVEALAPHPTNKDILYAGTVNGGVWKTTTAQAPDPHWIPLTDHLPSLSIG